jgi:hypothetical protein
LLVPCLVLAIIERKQINFKNITTRILFTSFFFARPNN